MVIGKIDINDETMAKDVLSLQRKAYIVEAELIGFQDIPPLQEALEDLRRSEEIFYGYFDNQMISGAIAIQVRGESVQICRMMVNPQLFRKGIAKKLLAYIEVNNRAAKRFIVSTGSKNEPALLFYMNMGYEKVSSIKVETNLQLTYLEKVVRHV